MDQQLRTCHLAPLPYLIDMETKVKRGDNLEKITEGPNLPKSHILPGR